MVSGARYRVAGAGGSLVLVVAAVLFANHPAVQELLTTQVPVTNQLTPSTSEGSELALETVTSTIVLLGALLPMLKPRPRRLLDVIFTTQKRALTGCFVLATIGYFDYTYRLPRPTLIVLTGVLLVGLPALFVTIRNQPHSTERSIVIGDDPARMNQVLEIIDASVVGCVYPPSPVRVRDTEGDPSRTVVADGWGGETTVDTVPFLGGLSRLDDVLVNHEVDTAILAFSTTDRGEFFGTLETCYEHGVNAMVHRDHADSVLISETIGQTLLVDVEVEPWDWQDYVVKRAFDVAFALLGLVLLSPLVVLIAAGIKFDSRGPVLYSQERTAEFGETFTIHKFRTMVPERATAVPTGEDAERITRVGAVLRKTHLDEIPQLWSILVGKMSVVGPRAAWRDEELVLENETDYWRKRWFVKPGLTGLAQINDVSSTDPETKLRYDLEYIRRQSFGLDVKIVIRQLWRTLRDLLQLARHR